MCSFNIGYGSCGGEAKRARVTLVSILHTRVSVPPRMVVSTHLRVYHTRSHEWVDLRKSSVSKGSEWKFANVNCFQFVNHFLSFVAVRPTDVI